LIIQSNDSISWPDLLVMFGLWFATKVAVFDLQFELLLLYVVSSLYFSIRDRRNQRAAGRCAGTHPQACQYPYRANWYPKNVDHH